MEPEELSRGCTVGVPGGPCREGLEVVTPLVSVGRPAGVFRPPESLRWSGSCWPMTCDLRRDKTKPQVRSKLWLGEHAVSRALPVRQVSTDHSDRCVLSGVCDREEEEGWEGRAPEAVSKVRAFQVQGVPLTGTSPLFQYVPSSSQE